MPEFQLEPIGAKGWRGDWTLSITDTNAKLKNSRGRLEVWFARRLVGKRIVGISLVNLLANRRVVPEFIQEEVTVGGFLQLLDLDFGFRELGLTNLGQPRALFVPGQQRFQRQFVRLHRFHDGFELLQRFFKCQR